MMLGRDKIGFIAQGEIKIFDKKPFSQKIADDAEQKG